MNTIILLALVASATAVPAQRDLSKIILKDFGFPQIPRVIKNHNQARIVGGEMASPHSYPFMAQIGITLDPSGTAQCGGSIIASEWILTAAHCLDSTEYPADVTIGSYLVYEDEDNEATITSFDLFQHPGWNSTTRANDIGLIKLVKKIQFNAFVQPIRLPSRSQLSESYTGRQATVIGWGRDSDSTDYLSDEQRFVTVPVLSNSNCSAQFGDVTVTDSQICTSGFGGKGPCNGDSGGPLIVTESDGNFTQVGIVSFGQSKCEIGDPAVYTKVSSYLDWISSTSGVTISS